MSGEATETAGAPKTVEIWVEQLSGPARALKKGVESDSLRLNGVDIQIREKHLPDLESDALDLLVFEKEMSGSHNTIVLAYAPSLNLIRHNSCPTGEWLDNEIGELMEGISDGELKQRQGFLLKELGRTTSGEGKVEYLPLMANTMVFVWNKSHLRRALTRGTPLSDSPPHRNHWQWTNFFDLLRALSEQGFKHPLAMCGSSDGALAYYEWCNFIGGLGSGSVLFDRKKAPHGWETTDEITHTMRSVLDNNRQHLARFVRVLQRYAHPAFLDIDQELQLDLILRGDAVGGFVWADRLAGLDEEEIDHLGIWPIPGERSIVSGAVALVPKKIDQHNSHCEDPPECIAEVLRQLWKTDMTTQGFIPANLQVLHRQVDGIVGSLTNGVTERASRDKNFFISENLVLLREHAHVKGMDRLLLYTYEALVNREPIVLEGGRYAHRIAECFSAATRRVWKRLQEEKKSISDIVNTETKILQHEMEDRFSPRSR
jgi:hypothetical protein